MNRHSTLFRIAGYASLALAIRLFLTILYEYRWYFPGPNFHSDFLIGRKYSFAGLYSVAFYAHIISSPPALMMGAFLMWAGARPQYRRAHRMVGRLQMVVVLFGVVPSGLIMAPYAYTGPIAALGFGIHSLATGFCALAAIFHVVKGRIQRHRVWASRCFLLLCTPLLLRFVSGAVTVSNLESDWSYRINAWLSWLVPLILHEIYLRLRSGSSTFSEPSNSHSIIPKRLTHEQC